MSVATLEDMKVLYDGFDLCSPMTSVSMTINGPAPKLGSISRESRACRRGVCLTAAEKEELRRAMIDLVGNDRNARWVAEGADAMARELANERWQKKWEDEE